MGSGRQLAINIQEFYSKTKCYTLLQNNFVSSHFICPMLLDKDYPAFLQTGIPILRDWDIDKFKDLRIIQTYLNSTDKGYVDDRVLKLVQCYEIIAHKWIKSKYTLPPELTVLKKKLKSALSDWVKEYPNYDTNGFWAGRVHNSLDWQKTVKLLEGVLLSQNLDLNKLDLNISKLVELRHSVAHSGRFGSVDAIKDLINGQFALRLFLLKTFHYIGKINDYRDIGWPNYKNISEFEIMACA